LVSDNTRREPNVMHNMTITVNVADRTDGRR
jgi:hypothetical protein